MPPRGRKESQTHDGRNRPQYSVLSFEDRTNSGEGDPDTSAEEAVMYMKGALVYLRLASSGTIDNVVLQAALDAEIATLVAAIALKAPIASPVFTGVVSIPDGTAAAPALTNTGEVDKGLFFPGSNAVGLAAKGLEVIRQTVATNLADAVLQFFGTLQATSASAAAAVFSGGVGIAKKLYVAGAVVFTSTLNVTSLATFAARIITDDQTNATTTTNGSLQTDGGISAVKAVYAGGKITSDDETEATDGTDGSLQTDGGLSVAKAAYIVGDLYAANMPPGDRTKNLVNNFGFTLTIDSPAAGDIRIAIKQGDDSTDPTAAAPVRTSFGGTQKALTLAAALNLDIDSLDDFELDTYAANTEVTLFIYAIDRGGTLIFGVGRRADYTRADSTKMGISTATSRDHIKTTAAVTTNDFMKVVGYFKATYNTTTPDWEAVTSESDVVGLVPGPHPQSIVGGWVNFNGTAGTIRDSYNVLGVSNDGAGEYTVTWDTDFASADYVVTSMGGSPGITVLLGSAISGASIGIRSQNAAGALVDTTSVFLSAFGDR